MTRTPITYVVVTLDFCSNVFGSSPCTATASQRCYNTYPTCRDKANFARTTKDYCFSTKGAPLPFKTGERPYIDGIAYYPTEIKDTLTTSAAVKIVFHDEPDGDVGIDPYLVARRSTTATAPAWEAGTDWEAGTEWGAETLNRTAPPGTFWKKLFARNANYLGRPVKIYEGFEGLPITDYEQRFVGLITGLSMSKGMVTMEVSDLLTSLNDISIPPVLDLKLAADVTDSALQMTLDGDDLGELDSTGYVRIDDEIIYYGAVNTTTGIISSCTRGSFSTTAAAHSLNAAVQVCRYFAPDSGFDHATTILLTDCAIAAGYVDSTQFEAERDDAAGVVDVDMSAMITVPTAASTLFFELMDLLNCKAWVGEDLKITCARNLPNRPGRSYGTLSDASGIAEKSGSVDMNTDSRISRCSIYWDRTAIGDVDDTAVYARLTTAVDSSAESVNEYGSMVEKTIMCRWLRSGYETEEAMTSYVRNLASRLVSQARDPMPIIEIGVERKDGDSIKTGAFVKLSTDELQDRNGDDLEGQPFQVIKREKKSEALIALSCLRMMPKKYCIISPAAYAGKDYETATAAEREYGALSDSHGLMAGGDDGYRIY